MEVDFDYVQPVLEKRKPAIKINGYSMFAEWTDPDSWTLLWNTDPQERWTQDAH